MTQILLTVPNAADELDILDFLAKHPSVTSTFIESERDENGNFQSQNLAKPGAPVSKQYMMWSIEKALLSVDEGRTNTLTQMEINLAKRRKDAFGI